MVIEEDVSSSHKAVVKQKVCTGLAPDPVGEQRLFTGFSPGRCHNLHLPLAKLALLDLPPAGKRKVQPQLAS